MAKRKHSTALFEVITQSPRYSRPIVKQPDPRPASPGLLTAAKEWLKQKPSKAVEKPAAPAVIPYLPAAPVSAIAVEPLALEYSPEPMAPVEEMHEAYASQELSHDDDAYAQPVAMAVDPENRQIAVRMSYSAAFIVAASVVLVVGLSLVIGQHLSRGGMPLLAQTTTAELLKRPAHPEVLEPTRRTNSTPRGNGDSTAVRAMSPSVADSHAAIDPRTVAPAAAVDGKRYIGLNYIIVQSYPVAEEKMAKEAAAFLNKEGMSCTVETGVKGYLPITVVGLQGFEKQSSPQFKAHSQRIVQLSAKYTSNNHSYKAFQPVAKKWDKQD